MLDWHRWRRMSWRDIAIQVGLVAFVILIVVSAIRSAQVNLAALGLTAGFSFLERATGWSYSFSLIDRTIDDSYARTLWIGFLNSVFVGLISIVFATIVGFIIGTARDSRNIGLRSAATIYVQFFRNIPLILQIVFLYAILIHLPGPRQALNILEVAFMSNRGVMLPVMNVSLPTAGVIVIGVAALAFLSARLVAGTLRVFGIWLLLTLAFVAATVYLVYPAEDGLWSVPELKGLRFRGGLTLSVELVAMILGIVIYGAAYIAEVVRGGLNEVPKGLNEAGESLGLGPFAVWFTIRVPMALRSIIPPLGNQWILIMKATTIGVAIGFSDLFYIVSTSITQSGQTLELVFILMASFLLINFTLAQFVNLLNKRLELKGYGG